MPVAEIADDTYRFVVKITDNLGQSSTSAEQTVALTRLPNDIRFFKDETQPNYNPISVGGVGHRRTVTC